MKRVTVSFGLLVCLIFVVSQVQAKTSKKIFEAIKSNYQEAIPHHGLDTAFENPDPSKIKTYVVVRRGGIPAERARFFVSWDDYDYRGAVVDLNKNDEINTRLGTPYTYLQPGDVMAVALVKEFAGGIYFKLLSPEIYIPENKRNEKRHSRVSVMLGFKLPKDLIASDDVQGALNTLDGWIKPFSSIEEANAYAKPLIESRVVSVEPEEKPVVENKKKDKKNNKVVEQVASPVDDDKVKNLEDKIEEARRQMEEAEKEMQKIKTEKKR